MFPEPYIPDHMLFAPAEVETVPATDEEADAQEEPVIAAKAQEVTMDEEDPALEEEVVVIAKRSAQEQQQQIDRNQLNIVDYYQQQLTPAVEQRQVLTPTAYLPTRVFQQYSQIVPEQQQQEQEEEDQVMNKASFH